MRSTRILNNRLCTYWIGALVLTVACGFAALTAPGQTAEKAHSKARTDAVLTVRPGAATATADPQHKAPETPSKSMPFPALPEKIGCYRTVDHKWVEVACASEKEKAMHAGIVPSSANSISSTSHAGPMIGTLGPPYRWHPTQVQETFDWGSITVSQPNPTMGSELDTLANDANAFSIQVNPFFFDCTDCKAGYPYPKSQPGDNSWVQFVYTQFGPAASAGTMNSNLCVWEFDEEVQYLTGGTSGGYNNCINPSMTDSVLPLDGPGAPTGQAEVVGYIQCPSSGTGQCTLYAIAHLPWSPSSDWWMVNAPDQQGLNGQWINVSGGLYGVGNGSVAKFSNTSLQTTVEAYTCYTNPTPTSVGGPGACAAPPPFEIWDIYFRLTAVPWTVTPSDETNNLTPQTPTFTCGYYDCVMSYLSQ